VLIVFIEEILDSGGEGYVLGDIVARVEVYDGVGVEAVCPEGALIEILDIKASR